MKWNKYRVGHLPDILLGDYRMAERIVTRPIHRHGRSGDAHFRWTEDPPGQIPRFWSEADDAHLFVWLPGDVCKGLSAEEAEALARQSFQAAVADARQA